MNCEKMLVRPEARDKLSVWCARQHFDVVALTEPGTLPPGWHGSAIAGDDDWHVFTPPPPRATAALARHHAAGAASLRPAGVGPAAGTLRDATVALLLHRTVHASVIASKHDESGRAVAVVVRGGTAHRPSHTLIGACYMPTAVDYVARGSAALAEADRLHAVLHEWCSGEGIDIAILLGDFNEARHAHDRRIVRASAAGADGTSAVRSGGDTARHDGYSLVGAMCGDGFDDGDGGNHAVNFIDCYRSRHATGGFTCAMPKGDERSESRIDYIFLRDLRHTTASARLRRPNLLPITVTAASVLPCPLASWPNAHHWPLAVCLTGDFPFDSRGESDGVGHRDSGDSANDNGDNDGRAGPLQRAPSLPRITDEQRTRAVTAMKGLVTTGGTQSLLARAMAVGRLASSNASHRACSPR